MNRTWMRMVAVLAVLSALPAVAAPAVTVEDWRNGPWAPQSSSEAAAPSDTVQEPEDLVIEQVAAESDEEEPAVTTADAAGEVPEAETVAMEEEVDAGLNEFIAEEQTQNLWIGYYGILYGPSISNPSSYQPTVLGEKDPDRPVLVKNFLTLGYDFTEDLTLSASTYWHWQPVMGNQLQMQDPYVRLGLDGILSTETVNLYSDFRIHFAVTNHSRENDLLAGFQFFQILTFVPWANGLIFEVFASERANFYGRQGFGDDLELYLGPGLRYQFSSRVALTLLYEINANHMYGAKPFDFRSDPSSLEPGISWMITPRLIVNPYLYLYPSHPTAASTSFGMTMSWQLL